MKRDTRTAYRARAAATERMVDEAVAAVKAEADARREAAKAAAAIRNTPVPFTDDDYNAARLVRTKLGWHKVAKVNAKSVSVETGYSWTDRIARDKVLEVRA
jgi:hypothetical protein